MKKLFALMLALMLATLAITAVASTVTDLPEEEEELYFLTGFVTEAETDYIVILADGMYYQVNISEETMLDGFETLAIGDWVEVMHNGQMTRSLPPQVHGMMIRSYSFSGVVTELAEGSFTLITEDDQEIVVNFDPEQFIGVQDEMHVTVYFDGMMTMSIPAQISAQHIRTQEMTGVIVEVLEDGFMIEDADGMQTIVHVSEETMLFTVIEPDAEVRVTTTGTMTMSLPAQVSALEVLPVLPEVTEDADAAEEIEVIESELPVDEETAIEG